MSDSDIDHFGPIDFFVVEFPDGEPVAGGFEALLELVDAGMIRVLDLELVRRSGSTVERVEIASFDEPSVAVFDGASSGLLDEDDLGQLADEIGDGSLAAVFVYEELAVLSVFDAFEAAGAHVTSEGHLSVVELVDALDSSENA
ncbi:MAG: hypothetical protein JST73_12925 [Actinobacteria bacterium]|nr:hypothetical protein [Actinomycetota bacterium]